MHRSGPCDFVEYDDAVVAMDTAERRCPGCDLVLRVHRVERMNVVQSILGELHERTRPVDSSATVARPVTGVRVLDQIHPAWRDRRPKFVERGDLMTRHMAAIVDDDVERAVTGN